MNSSLIIDILEIFSLFINFYISRHHMISELRELVGEILSPKLTKVIVRTVELNNKNTYVLQIGASLCYKLG